MSKVVIYDDNAQTTKAIVYTILDDVSKIEKYQGNNYKIVPDESIPPLPETKTGKNAVLYINLETNQLWYEYVDRPLTPEEELQQLKERQALMQQALDDLLLGGI